jgi:hypothetical protein
MVTNDLLSFLKNNNVNSMQFELIRFVVRHPKAKLSFYVIARALGTASTELGNALVALIEKDILIAEINENGLSTYSLSGSNKTDAYIRELAALDWSEAMGLKRLLV